jgi:biopolymer transport protein ExbB/TolQ
MTEHLTTAVTTIVAAVVAATPTTIAALAALRQGKKNMKELRTVHLQINSRLEDLLAETKTRATVVGVEAGKYMASEKRKRSDKRPRPGRPTKEDSTPEKVEARVAARRLRYLERREQWRKDAAERKAKGITDGKRRTYGALTAGEEKAIKAMKWRVPKEAPPEAAELAGEAFAVIVDVMRRGVPYRFARNTLSAAVAVRDDICGPVVRRVEVDAKMSYEQLVNASMAPPDRLPPAPGALREAEDAEFSAVPVPEVAAKPEATYEEDPTKIAGEDEV